MKIAASPEQRLKIRRALLTPDTFPRTLVAILLDAFDQEALNWHPTTIRDELQKKYACQMPEGNFNALMAGVTVLTTDVMWATLSGFARMAEALSDQEVDWDDAPLPDIYECAWSVAQAKLIDPDDQTNAHPDIGAYIAIAMADGGLFAPPESLKTLVKPSDLSGGDYVWSGDPAMTASVFAAAEQRKTEVDNVTRQLTEEAELELLSLFPHLTNSK